MENLITAHLRRFEDVGDPSRSLQVGGLQHLLLQRLTQHPQFSQGLGGVVVLFVQKYQHIIQTLQARVTLDGLGHTKLQPMSDAVDCDEVAYIRSQLRRHAVLTAHVDGRPVGAEEDQLLLPVGDTGQLEHCNTRVTFSSKCKSIFKNRPPTGVK